MRLLLAIILSKKKEKTIMNKASLTAAVLSLLAVIGCSGAQGNAGLDGKNGEAGVGIPGRNGIDGTNGEAGVGIQGPAGIPGRNGTNGTNGTNGVGEAGATGDKGEVGSPGLNGVSLCGDVPFAQWHQPCGSDLVGVCGGHTGEWECHLFLAGTTTGDLTQNLNVVCADSTTHGVLSVGSSQAANYPSNPVDSDVSATCLTTDCNGFTNTAGVAVNVALVRSALTIQLGQQESQDQDGGAQTAHAGLCRNALAHCLSTETQVSVSGGQVVLGEDSLPVVVAISGNDEGVLVSDFGDLTVPQGDEAKMSTGCVDANNQTRLWACSVDSNGVASVQCSGAITQ